MTPYPRTERHYGIRVDPNSTQPRGLMSDWTRAKTSPEQSNYVHAAPVHGFVDIPKQVKSGWLRTPVDFDGARCVPKVA